MGTRPDLTTYLDQLPSIEEIRTQLAANLRERQLLNTLLKLATEKRSAKEAASKEQPTDD